jgi:uncharacterized protein (DUF934 family)
MATANRSIKARSKASPDRIQSNIKNSKVIKVGAVENNQLIHLAETEELDVDNLPSGDISVPLDLWLEHKVKLKDRDGLIAVQVASDQDPQALAGDLNEIAMIVLPFVMFMDGRGYSHANNLRLKLAYQGEIRAVGDVHFDHLGFLARVGVSSFEIPDGENHEYALKAFTEFSEVYQPAADGKPLIFSRRRTVH